MRAITLTVFIVAVGASAASAADSWGIDTEKLVTFKGKVVDIACELTKSCPGNCGDGKRQLGILDTDGKLFAAAKSQTPFAGLAKDLLPHCGKSIEIDGLIVENPAMRLLAIQNIRTSDDQKFAPTEAFAAEWTKAHGAADEWFRADPTVKATIEADGVFGIKSLVPKPDQK